MKINQLRKIILTGLCAAIIFVGVSLFRIPIPALVGRPFIHFGNTFAVLTVLILGFRYGAVAAMIGLGLFDLLNGYAATAWLTVLEALVLAAVVAVVFKGVNYQQKPRVLKLYAVSLAAGLIKLLTSWLSGIVESMMVGTSFSVAVIRAFLSLPATLINSIVLFLVVPLLYVALAKTVLQRLKI
ncbi:ECF transporter S component [Bombilactobacillus thymidiniphilus]|uniref:ECF transporter S component n=1 Tax=Bombilactobacillus thymidiniphilus TaxID=2923363 RepID=A0ABY4PC83_9LACO|nr:ECF transporter S component [Bombilactobacillus thymidiniphilus]UQS83152.1 ECF transporter S component [Bombilactobacillus thymidiniphilus]